MFAPAPEPGSPEEQQESGRWWRYSLVNPEASAEAAYRAGLRQAAADVATAQALTARAEAALGRIAASFPELLAGGDTAESLARVADFVYGSTEAAGNKVGQLLTNQQALADAGLVSIAHDLLGDLSAVRNAAQVLSMLLSRVQPPVQS